MIEDAGGDEVYEVTEGIGLMVEAWHGWEYGGASAGDCQHVFELNNPERCFAGYEDQGGDVP